jgi:hypothetical protein
LTPPVGRWKAGVEIELLMPPGRDRRAFAERVAEAAGGRVRRVFSQQSEPGLVPGKPTMANLTPGFEAVDAEDRRLVLCVDDLTLLDDLDRRAPPQPGWYRVVGDDARLMRLAGRVCDPEAPIERVLDPLGEVLGGHVFAAGNGMFKCVDSGGATVAIASGVPGERGRPCEVVTPPMTDDLPARVGHLLGVAAELGCTIPAEGATHVHLDAGPLAHAGAVARLMAWYHAFGPALKPLVRTNPRCRRLGPWPDALLDVVRKPGFEALAWPEARAAMQVPGLSKFCDLNLANLVYEPAGKHTVELRIFPVWLGAAEVIAAVDLFEAIARRALEPAPVPWVAPFAPGVESARVLRATPGVGEALAVLEGP